MKIAASYSHANGHEHIRVHAPGLWTEIEDAIAAVDAQSCLTKRSGEKTRLGKLIYNPANMNRRFRDELNARGWHEARVSYWVTADAPLMQRTMQMAAERQREEILGSGRQPFRSGKQTDFVKGRIALEVQFADYAAVAYDIFIKHMAFFMADQIDVGVEIVPMKELQTQMSSGVPYYESALYDILRQDRSAPAVPLVLVGVTC